MMFPISQDTSRSTRKSTSPLLGPSGPALEVVGSGFPTWSDLAIRMEADGLLIHSDIYGVLAMCQADNDDPRGSKTGESLLEWSWHYREGLGLTEFIT